MQDEESREGLAAIGPAAENRLVWSRRKVGKGLTDPDLKKRFRSASLGVGKRRADVHGYLERLSVEDGKIIAWSDYG